MAIEFDCPSCRSRIRTPDEAAGKKARCPHCQQISSVPVTSTLGNLGATTAPLPSSQAPAWAPTPTPPAPPPPPNAPKVNPFLTPTPPPGSQPTNPTWLPPDNAFAPVGSPQTPGYSSAGYPANSYSPPVQLVSTNPFGDQATFGNAPLNPYQVPPGFAMQVPPFSNEEVRRKLLGPAIGITLGALLCIGVVLFGTIAVLVDDEFHRDIQGADNAETIAAYVILGVFVLACIAPSLLAIVGSISMFRGRGLVMSWTATIAALLNPCCLISGAFSIWGMVVLSDPRVSSAMK